MSSGRQRTLARFGDQLAGRCDFKRLEEGEAFLFRYQCECRGPNGRICAVSVAIDVDEKKTAFVFGLKFTLAGATYDVLN